MGIRSTKVWTFKRILIVESSKIEKMGDLTGTAQLRRWMADGMQKAVDEWWEPSRRGEAKLEGERNLNGLEKKSRSWSLRGEEQ